MEVEVKSEKWRANLKFCLTSIVVAEPPQLLSAKAHLRRARNWASTRFLQELNSCRRSH